MSKGIELIAAERQRQIDEEGWTSEHDDSHDKGELADAAAVYARVTQANVLRVIEQPYVHGWPWDIEWLKPFGEPPASNPYYKHSFPVVDRLRCLVKAGALIAAEIDRLQRIEAQ